MFFITKPEINLGEEASNWEIPPDQEPQDPPPKTSHRSAERLLALLTTGQGFQKLQGSRTPSDTQDAMNCIDFPLRLLTASCGGIINEPI